MCAAADVDLLVDWRAVMPREMLIEVLGSEFVSSEDALVLLDNWVANKNPSPLVGGFDGVRGGLCVEG